MFHRKSLRKSLTRYIDTSKIKKARFRIAERAFLLLPLLIKVATIKIYFLPFIRCFKLLFSLKPHFKIIPLLVIFLLTDLQMKNIYNTIIYSILVLSFTSFSGCKKEVMNNLAVSPAKIEFEKEGSFTGMSIQTDADSWSISNPASEWLVISRTSGTQKTALVTLSVNTKTIEPRIDTLTITAGNAKPVKVIVSQPSSDYIYTLSANYDSLTFKRAGNSTAISITTNAPQWNISHNADWLQFSQVTGNSGSTTITVTALENMGIDSRSAMITISAEYAQTV